LRYFLTDYVPLIFWFGYKIRTLAWRRRKADTGGEAVGILKQMVILMWALRPATGRAEYLDSALFSLLVDHPYLSTLPGCFYNEESREASLGELTRRMARDMRAANREEFEKYYVYMNRFSDLQPKNLDDPKLPLPYTFRCQSRLLRLIIQLENNTVPWVHYP
jgi:hypothetical protein